MNLVFWSLVLQNSRSLSSMDQVLEIPNLELQQNFEKFTFARLGKGKAILP